MAVFRAYSFLILSVLQMWLTYMFEIKKKKYTNSGKEFTDLLVWFSIRHFLQRVFNVTLEYTQRDLEITLPLAIRVMCMC